MKNLGASETVSRLTTSSRCSGFCAGTASVSVSEFVGSAADDSAATMRNTEKKASTVAFIFNVIKQTRSICGKMNWKEFIYYYETTFFQFSNSRVNVR